MDCNRKVSEIFRGWKEGSQRPLSVAQNAPCSEMNLLIEKTAQKSAGGRPRSFGAFYVEMHVGQYMGGSRRVVQWRTQSRAKWRVAHSGRAQTTLI